MKRINKEEFSKISSKPQPSDNLQSSSTNQRVLGGGLFVSFFPNEEEEEEENLEAFLQLATPFLCQMSSAKTLNM